jgi:hypothetical protein
MDDAHNLWKRASNLWKRIPEVRVSTRITQTCMAAKAPRSCPLWVIFVRSARSRRLGMSALLRKRTCASCFDTSAKCHKPTFAVQQVVLYSITLSAPAIRRTGFME